MTRYRHVASARPDPCPWFATVPQENPRPDDDGLCWGWREECGVSCYRARMASRAAARERRENGPRKFPMPQGGDRGKSGFCSWCGLGIMKGDKLNLRRGWHDGRDREPECLQTFYLHTRAPEQKAFLLQRDGPACHDCGKIEGGWVKWGVTNPDTARTWGVSWVRTYPEDVYVGPFCRLAWASDLEIEHDTPLWLVEHLDPDERRPFFGPENLLLRCVPCHKAKTAEEAAQRAKGDRIKAGPRIPKRKLQGRGFDKTRTRGFDQRVRPR